MIRIPKLSKDLIKMLDELIPERCPSIDDTPKTIWLNVGKRELIRSLVLASEEQQKEDPFSL